MGVFKSVPVILSIQMVTFALRPRNPRDSAKPTNYTTTAFGAAATAALVTATNSVGYKAYRIEKAMVRRDVVRGVSRCWLSPNQSYSDKGTSF